MQEISYSLDRVPCHKSDYLYTNLNRTPTKKLHRQQHMSFDLVIVDTFLWSFSFADIISAPTLCVTSRLSAPICFQRKLCVWCLLLLHGHHSHLQRFSKMFVSTFRLNIMQRHTCTIYTERQMGIETGHFTGAGHVV